MLTFPALTILELVLVSGCVLVATITDLQQRKVYNLLTFPMMLTGIIHHGLAEGWSGIAGSCLGIGVAVVVLLIPFAMGLMGGGDLKLMAAIGAWLGWQSVLVITLASCLLNAVVSICVLWWRGGLGGVRDNVVMSSDRLSSWVVTPTIEEGGGISEQVASPKSRRQLIPFTVMIGFGLALFVFISY